MSSTPPRLRRCCDGLCGAVGVSGNVSTGAIGSTHGGGNCRSSRRWSFCGSRCTGQRVGGLSGGGGGAGRIGREDAGVTGGGVRQPGARTSGWAADSWWPEGDGDGGGAAGGGEALGGELRVGANGGGVRLGSAAAAGTVGHGGGGGDVWTRSDWRCATVQRASRAAYDGGVGVPIWVWLQLCMARRRFHVHRRIHWCACERREWRRRRKRGGC